MAFYKLSDRHAFPSPNQAEKDGLLAVGGDLSVERLLLAYSMGIFPWYNEGDPILWWSPDPRTLLFLDDFRASERLKRLNRQGHFQVTMDTAFEEVIGQCSKIPRPGQEGTWITQEMVAAYIRLHEEGYAHSVECWREGSLVGGLYGLSIGSCFSGESMFSHESNASKIALLRLVDLLKSWDFQFIDCQLQSKHLFSIGAKNVPRTQFLELLEATNKAETRRGKWILDKSASDQPEINP